MDEKISIIIPIYNAEQYLKRCIDSVLKQTYKNLEIILIDDGSIDNSFSICKEYEKKDSRIICRHNENSGPSKARNVGIDIASGQYIGFVDSDDYIEKNMFENLYINMKKYDADISICEFREILKNRNVRKYGIDNIKKITIYNYKNSEDAIKELLKDKKITNHTFNKLYKKTLFNKLRFDENLKFVEDMDLMYKLFYKARNIVYSNFIGYNYIQICSSITHTLDDRNVLNLLYTVKERYNFINDKYVKLNKINIQKRNYYIYRAHMILAKHSRKIMYNSQEIIDEYKFYRNNYKFVQSENKISMIEKAVMDFLYMYRKLFYEIISHIYN